MVASDPFHFKYNQRSLCWTELDTLNNFKRIKKQLLNCIMELKSDQLTPKGSEITNKRRQF